MGASREEVMHALEQVIDPELGRSVVELDMVRRLELDDGRVDVEIALTVAGCPLRSSFENQVERALGVGIFCGDYSHCEIERNHVADTRPDGSGMRTRMGYAIQAHYGAKATVSENRLVRNARGVQAFLNATIRHLE